MCFSALLYAAEIGHFWFCLKKMLMWNGKWRLSSVYWHLKPKTLTDWHYEQTIITRFLDLRTWPILVGGKATARKYPGLAVKGLIRTSKTEKKSFCAWSKCIVLLPASVSMVTFFTFFACKFVNLISCLKSFHWNRQSVEIQWKRCRGLISFLWWCIGQNA